MRKNSATACHISRYLLRNAGMPLGLVLKRLLTFCTVISEKKGTLTLYWGIHSTSMGRAVAWCLTLCRRKFTFKF